MPFDHGGQYGGDRNDRVVMTDTPRLPDDRLDDDPRDGEADDFELEIEDDSPDDEDKPRSVDEPDADDVDGL